MRMISKKNTAIRCLATVLGITVLFTGCGSSAAVFESAKAGSSSPKYDGNLRISDGLLQPMLEYSSPDDPEYTNEGSDIIRYCVYVETDHDTDNDGMADLVKAFVQVPRGAVEGKYKAATIYDPTPYGVGTVEENYSSCKAWYLEKEFDYKILYKDCEKRTPAGEMSTMDAAQEADPSKDWNYEVPNSEYTGYTYKTLYDYYLVRGYAVVEASGIGTYGSEGYELCGTDLERDSHKAVVQWLTGDRVAYTDKAKNIAIKADWSNGNVAMTGCSYGGTLPYEVATTGVKGLKTIIPYAGIASWYDYTNSQGAPIIFDVDYRDYLSAYNCGGVFLDNDWTVLDDGYRSWLWQIAQDESATNGDYAPVWAETDYSDDYADINCSALIVHGLNDFNVTTKQSNLMYNAFKKAGKPVKMVLHQDGHNYLYDYTINGTPWLEIQNKWLAHYLYDVDNGIEDMAELTVQSNTDGTFREYSSFGEYEHIKTSSENDADITEVTSVGLAEYANTYSKNEDGVLKPEELEKVYLGMNERNVAVYDIDIPEGGTISGVPEINVKLSTGNTNLDGTMITAVLVDTKEDDLFKAYMLKERLGNCVPNRTVSEIDQGGGLDTRDLYEHVQSSTNAKCFSFGWTDLCNPGCGPDSSEYTKQDPDEHEPGKYYDYTFYMLPTVYTVEKGHKLKLLLMTWDPGRAFLDEGYDISMDLSERLEKYSYSYVIDNTSIDVRLPLIKTTP